MPRRARVILANTPHHVVQRGHNRRSVFAQRQDYEYYLGNLVEWKDILGLKVYSWCLMTNHIHLIVDPGENIEGVGAMMRRLAARQTRYVNTLERRTGTLWESRYHASPIQTDAYLLACSRYIELNPVRARMVAQPEEYEWSSYRAKAGKCAQAFLDLDPCFKGLGEDVERRAMRYIEFVGKGVPEDEYKLIHDAINRNQLTGNERFVDEVEARIGTRIETRGRGRPKGRTD